MAAGAGIGGGVVEGAFSAIATKQSRKWQRKMARHAITWRVADLRRAGLNPLLAISGGLSGGAGAGPQAHTPAFTRNLTDALRSGAERPLRRKETKVAEQRALTLRGQEELMQLQGERERAVAGESMARRDLLIKQAETEGYNAQHRALDIPGAINRSAVEAGRAGKALRYIQRAREAIGIGPIIVPPRRIIRRGGR